MSTEYLTALGTGISTVSDGIVDILVANVDKLMVLFVTIVGLFFVMKLIKRITGR